jgi:uncharacterized membrane protein
MTSDDRGIRRIITAGLLLAITLLLTLTRIGMIPVPTPAAHATIAHVPAILGGILEGSLVGLIVGLGFGFGSFMSATVPMFKDPLVAVLPRLFIGATAAFTFAALRHARKQVLYGMVAVMFVLLMAFSYQTIRNILWLGIVVGLLSIAITVLLYLWMQREDVQVVGLAISATVGTLTNTVLVLGMGVLRGYMTAEAAWAIGLMHGIPEVIVAAVVVVAVVTAVRQIGQKSRRSRLTTETTRRAG